jgi:RNA polymerase sigma-70 factor, ECF subfamily
MNIGKIEEKLLLYKAKKNDKEAFIKAYNLYIDQLYRFIYFKVGNREEAEDLCSSVFLKTWNHILENSLKDHKTLKALLYKISRNLIIDHYRKNAGRETISLDDEIGTKIIDQAQNIHNGLETKADLMVLETKLPELKDEYREVIILRFVNELSIKEIADILDKSKGNVRVLIYRSLTALRGLLNQDEKMNNSVTSPAGRISRPARK